MAAGSPAEQSAKVDLVACYRTVAGPVGIHRGREWSLFDWRDRCAQAASVGFSGLGLWSADITGWGETSMSTLDRNRHPQ